VPARRRLDSFLAPSLPIRAKTPASKLAHRPTSGVKGKQAEESDATDDFGGRRQGATAAEVQARFTETLSRARPKELAHDYLELETGSHAAMVSSLVVGEWEKNRPGTIETPTPSESFPTNDLDARQQAAAERWAARQQNLPAPGQGVERTNTHTPSNSPDLKFDRTPELRREGPEDDLEL
jgi:hypothetical protein